MLNLRFWIFILFSIIFIYGFITIYSFYSRPKLESFMSEELKNLPELDSFSASKLSEYKRYAEKLTDAELSSLSQSALSKENSQKQRVLSVLLLGYCYKLNSISYLKEVILTSFTYNEFEESKNEIEILIRSLALEGLSRIARDGGIQSAKIALDEIGDQLNVPELHVVYEQASAYAKGESDLSIEHRGRGELKDLIQSESVLEEGAQ